MAAIEGSKAYLVRTKEDSKDISRINTNTARTIERTSSLSSHLHRERNISSSNSGSDVESQQQYSGRYGQNNIAISS
jgi:hypothetical protein